MRRGLHRHLNAGYLLDAVLAGPHTLLEPKLHLVGLRR
jgi:hypothetical protein